MNLKEIRNTINRQSNPNELHEGKSLIEISIDNEWSEEISLLMENKPSLLSKDNSSNLIEKYSKNTKFSKTLSILVDKATEEEILEVTENKNSALFYIAKSNNHYALEQAIRKCNTITFSNGFGQSIINYYCKYANFISQKTLSILIDSSKSELGEVGFKEFINLRDSYGKTAFSNLSMSAIRRSNIKKKQSLLKSLDLLEMEGADINLTDNVRVSPVLWACIEDDEIVFDKLLKMGADLSQESIDGDTCLYQSIMRESSFTYKIIDNLDEIKKSKNSFSKHPVFEAIKSGDEHLSMSIIAKMNESLDLADYDNDSHTLLILAIKSSSLELTQSLVSLGANVNKSNNHGMTPLMYALFNFNKETNVSRKIIKLLIDNGADINAIDNKGETAIDIAKYLELESQVGTLLYNNNIKKIADEFYGGDKNKAQDLIRNLGDFTIEQLSNSDIQETHLMNVVEDQVNFKRTAEQDELLKNIAEGKRLIGKNLAQNIPILMGVGAISDSVLSQNNGDYMLAAIAATCSVSNYLLSFSREDRKKMVLSIDHTISTIDRCILDPIRDVCRKTYVSATMVKYDVLDAIDFKWRRVKRNLNNLKQALNSPKVRSKEIQEKNPSGINDVGQLSKEELGRILSVAKGIKNSDIKSDSEMIDAVYKSLNGKMSEERLMKKHKDRNNSSSYENRKAG